ncbi:50S ribosomal protein L35ae [Candidatus Woesearchaeota archaeon]|nr:50S ribosomal protein L35ae [Candidatus Woesearchaeota archaeon]
MEGTIVNFRGSYKTKSDNHMVISVNSVDSKEKAQKLVGKEVSWTSPAGKEIKGKVASSHGNSGALRIIFEKGMPGQAIGTKVKFLGV